MSQSDLAQMDAALVAVPADFALERLASADFVGGWALGSMNLQPVAQGVFRGQSLFDGSAAHVEIRPNPALGLIDFAVGDADTRSPRIFIRVTPGVDLGHDAECCLVTLHALRGRQADAERWARTCTAHAAEILLIRGQLERAFAEAQQ